MVWMKRPEHLYLCPGDEQGAHITDSSIACACGNTNLASLGRILDRETTVVSLLDILIEKYPELGNDLKQGMRLYNG